jgi:hypothetical protein
MALSLEPTIEEMNGFKTVNDIAEWCDLPAESRTTLFSILGATSATKPRTIAAIPENVFQKTVEDWRDAEGKHHSPVISASAGLVGAVARKMFGIVSQAMMNEKVLENNLEIERLKAHTAQPPVATKSARSIKLATIVDQANDLEVDPMPHSEVEAAYKTYKDKMGDMPRPEDDVTTEQLAGLRALFATGAPPYVDLAVWGPFGRRIQKKLKLTGLVMTASGTLQQAQLYGPPNLDEWLAGFAVFKTGAIMLGEVTPATLDLWTKVITGYAHRWGADVWALIYQTDVRARLEHMERVRRQGAAEHAQAIAGGGYHSFDPKHPWDWVFRTTADDAKFWRRELEDSALLIKTRVEKISASIDHDAPLGRGFAAAPGNPQGHSDGAPRKIYKGAGKGGGGGGGGRVREDRPRQHSVGSDGMLTSNRRGVPLCAAFQTGACTSNDAAGRCTANPNRAHQCAKCLGIGHGAQVCPHTAAVEPRAKGKGKKGNHKGYGKGYGKYPH